MAPGEPVDDVFREFEDTVTMSPSELRAFGDSEQFDIYSDRKSGGQPPNEPREDVLQLLDTPKSEWADEDDGFNEVAEAREVTGFVARMRGTDSGDPMPGTDPPLSRRDASLLNWGFDPNPGRSDFVGDRQR